ERGAGAGAAGVERGAGDRRERAVGMTVEAGDRVVAGVVVVDVDVADARRAGGECGACGEARDDDGDGGRQAEQAGDAVHPCAPPWWPKHSSARGEGRGGGGGRGGG